MKEPSIEQLMAADVTGNAPIGAKPVTKAVKSPATSTKEQTNQSDTYSLNKEIEEKIQQVEKGKSFTIKLTTQELAQAIRSAEANNMTAKNWLQEQVSSMLVSDIGKPKVVGPSGASTKRITGPSNTTRWHTT